MQAGGRAPSGDLSPRARFSCKDGKTPIPIQGARYCHQLAQSRDGHCRAGVSWRPRSLHVFVGEPIALLFCGTRQTPRPRPPPKSSDKPRSLLAAAGGGGEDWQFQFRGCRVPRRPLLRPVGCLASRFPRVQTRDRRPGTPAASALGRPIPRSLVAARLVAPPARPCRGAPFTGPQQTLIKKMGGTHLRPRFCTSCSSCVTLCSSEAMSAV